MASIVDAELFGVTESSATICFTSEVEQRVELRLDGESRAVSEGGPGTRLLRVEGLSPGTRRALQIVGADGVPLAPDRYLPAHFETLPAPTARQVASFATLNDLHFGEPRVGGLPGADYEAGDAAPGFPVVRAEDTERPYWQFMNEDAVTEINDLRVDATLVKGDIADRGRPEQFAAAADCFARLERPHHAFLGNHDHYGRAEGLEVDGYGLLGQPPAPRGVDLGGWRLLLLETSEPGEHHGVLPEARLAWLDDALEETRASATPTLLLMHHQPVPAAFRESYPNRIGIVPEHSQRLFELLGAHPQLRAVLVGHTHRNRLRRHPASGDLPYVEVQCSKDYPGGFAHYRLFEDGSLRQEARRTGSARALGHSARCRQLYRGHYRDFALGPLEARSFAIPAPGRGGGP